jgi:hypothetical protein
MDAADQVQMALPDSVISTAGQDNGAAKKLFNRFNRPIRAPEMKTPC